MARGIVCVEGTLPIGLASYIKTQPSAGTVPWNVFEIIEPVPSWQTVMGYVHAPGANVTWHFADGSGKTVSLSPYYGTFSDRINLSFYDGNGILRSNYVFFNNKASVPQGSIENQVGAFFLFTNKPEVEHGLTIPNHRTTSTDTDLVRPMLTSDDVAGTYFKSTTYPDDLYDWLNIQQISSDPYNKGGISLDGIGGLGNFSNLSTDIGKPNLPTLTASATGFVTLYNPTLEQLRNLASYMWAGLFDIQSWRKIFADPMDAILGLNIVPVAVPSSGGGIVNVGNIPTGIYMNYASSQFIELDCGSIQVEEYWGAYLDYAPYTKAEIYLPYIGMRPIDIDDIMGKTVNVSYHVDILSGACVCYVKCGGSILYTFAGQCSTSIPVTSNSFASIVQGALHIAGAVGSLVATGGMSAPLVAGDVASIASTTGNMKPNIERSGAVGGSAGLMGVQKPYLIITRPKQCLPKYQNEFQGYPCFTYKKLSNLKGYTVVDTIHLENVPCTENEQAEIEALLKSGVII